MPVVEGWGFEDSIDIGDGDLGGGDFDSVGVDATLWGARRNHRERLGLSRGWLILDGCDDRGLSLDCDRGFGDRLGNRRRDQGWRLRLW